MILSRLSPVRALLILALALAGAIAACGGDSEPDDDGAGPAATSTVSQNAGGDEDDNGDDDVLTLVSRNTLFDKSELRTDDDEVTIRHDNQDAGVIHNVAVHRGSDATGELMGKTDLEAGPVEQTLTLALEPDEYFYVCEAHPATMTGTLIVD